MWWETEELDTKLEEQILLGFQQTSFQQTQFVERN